MTRPARQSTQPATPSVPSAPPPVAIIAATLYGNRGAQAMLETVVGVLSRQQRQRRFHVFSYYPADDRRLLRDPRIDIHSATPLALVAWLLPWSLLFGLLQRLFGARVLRLAPAPIRGLAESALLVDLAGVAFIDGREKFLPFNILTLVPAWLLATPVVKMPQATGPYRNRINRLCARLALPRCAKVWARGEYTLAHLQQAGFSGLNFERADDIAFNFEESFALTDEGGDEVERCLQALQHDAAVGRRGVIGLCPSSVVAARARKRGGDYETVLVDLVQRLAGHGFQVLLFPNATRAGDGDAERNNDLPLIRRILAGLVLAADAPAPVAVSGDVNAAAIKRLIAASDIVLVSRFHAMVGALSLARPPVVLGWSHKYAEVMARFGLEDQVMDYAAMDRAGLEQAVLAVFEQRAVLADTIRTRLPAIQADALRPLQELPEAMTPR
ncbi:MAG: polysaccharide pyruvyl transferase family protein [Xanthomonadales bacterium]|nr:polysaccharide pyruvyl transferase family protein [Xanthomonadales bacterium]